MRNRGWIGNTQVVGVPFRDKFESLAKRVIKLAVSLQRLQRLYTGKSMNSIRGFTTCLPEGGVPSGHLLRPLNLQGSALLSMAPPPPFLSPTILKVMHRANGPTLSTLSLKGKVSSAKCCVSRAKHKN